MKIVVNWERCEANAVCVRAAPEVFRVDDDDRLHLLVDDVPSELRPKVEKAVRACPRGALSLEEP
ncbi:ferredoxin [Sorangium cellulosum]|jgi:ferredoxin|uniref:Ferredoxin n=1 Tax=Sorangium cellulosum TaxID=56 RepID=A0A4P2Q017_SORCE|nr:ferredoxin [Sorangium cellulosum]AUX22470.1 ferredoxin [Sorangium cellulosum]